MKHYKDLTESQKAWHDKSYASMQVCLKIGAMDRMDYYDGQPKEVRDRMKENNND